MPPRAMPLLVIPIAAAACGGTTTQVKLTPLASVKKAVVATARARTEEVTMKVRGTAAGRRFSVTGGGNFDNGRKLGAFHFDVSVAAATVSIDEVTSGTTFYMKSPLFTRFLPHGKTWVKLDLQKALPSNGIDFSALASQSPSRSMQQLRALSHVREIGDEQIDGVETTHYRGRLDISKEPQGAKFRALTHAKYGPYNVWIGKDDGYVHRIAASYSVLIPRSGRQTYALTMTFSNFGVGVGVSVPPAAVTFDETGAKRPGA